MKNNVGLHLILLDTPKTQAVSPYAKISTQLKNAARVFYLTFLAVIACGGLSYAQSSAANSSNSNHDITTNCAKKKKGKIAKKKET